MIPIVVAGIAALAGGIGGALSRQPEINKLKEQVRSLQAEIHRLQRVIKEQDRQITELKLRYQTLKAYNFVEKSKQKSKVKGALMFQYCFKEYVELQVQIANNKSSTLNEYEFKFISIFSTLSNNIDISINDQLFLREYINRKYSYEISSLKEISTEQLVNKVEGLNVY